MGRAKRNPSSRLCPGVAVMGFASLYPSYGEKVAKSSAPVSIPLALLRRPASRLSRPLANEKTDARVGIRAGHRGKAVTPAGRRPDDRAERGHGPVQRRTGEGR